MIDVCPCCNGLKLTAEQWRMLMDAARGSTDMVHVDYGEPGRELGDMLYAYEDIVYPT